MQLQQPLEGVQRIDEQPPGSQRPGSSFSVPPATLRKKGTYFVLVKNVPFRDVFASAFDPLLSVAVS